MGDQDVEPVRVWCVAYDDPTPYMDGVKTIRMGEYRTYGDASAAEAVVRSRSERAPKRDLHIESREVTPWVRTSHGSAARP